MIVEVMKVGGLDVELEGAYPCSPPWQIVEDDDMVVDLTRREVIAAELICGGQTRSAVAEAMRMSVKTFDTHRSHILQKMRVRNEVELLRLALRSGWVRL